MNLQKNRTVRLQFLLRPAVTLCFLLLAAITCSAQNFDGGGDGFSWNDRFNWNPNTVPTSAMANIGPGFSVQLNSATTTPTVNIQALGADDFDASFCVNAPLSTGGRVQAVGERATVNVNANIFANDTQLIAIGVTAQSGGTLNLNAGTISADLLLIEGNSVFNQIGGHFDVRSLDLVNFTSTATIGPDDNVTGDISMNEGEGVGHLICNRPLNLVEIFSNQSLFVTNGSIVSINDDVHTGRSFIIEEGSVLNWNAGVISTDRMTFCDATIDRSGNEHLDVESFEFYRFSGDGSENFTIRENDVILLDFFIEGTDDFPADVTIEAPHTIEFFGLFGTSMASYQQQPGETEGLSFDFFDNSSFENATLNLGFDSQSAGGLDWVFRTMSPSADVIEEMIDDGRIVVTGAEFTVQHDPTTGFTYIQEAARECDLNISVVNNELRINGTVGRDDIVVTQNGNTLEVDASGDCFESFALQDINRVVINGFGGVDTIRVDAAVATLINGGSGADEIFGGTLVNVIFGGPGADTIYGGPLNDTLNAGRGQDTVFGFAGDDTIIGGDASDTLNGGTGNDELLGGLGADTLNGNGGDDTLIGNVGADTLNGGGGNDQLNGLGGPDTMIGGPGNDEFRGGEGFDTFDGGGGDDTALDNGEVEVSIENT